MDTLTLARSFTSLLLDTAAKGTVLLALACLAAWLSRRSSAALRHSIWCLTMGGLLLLPIAAWALPAWQLPILPPVPAPIPIAEVVRLPPQPPASPAPEANPFPTSPANRSTASDRSGSRQTSDVLTHSGSRETSAAPPIETPRPARLPEPITPALTTLESLSLAISAGWTLGATLFGALLLVGLWRTIQMRRRSVLIGDGEWPQLLAELRPRLGLSRSVELREHAHSVVPLTWGIWRPVVLVPKLAREWAEPMRRAVLLHELAHVQRGDVACQVLGRLTCVLFWFHPLTWFALRQLRQEREQACDDAVVQSGEKASDYAEQLLAVARLCVAPRGLSLGVAMAEGSSLERRVVSLFDSARSHEPLTRRVAIASVLIGGAILAGLAPIQPTPSQAEPIAAPAVLPPDSPPVDPANDTTNNTPPKKADEYPFPLEQCSQPFSDPERLAQLERLHPVYGEAKRGIQLGLAINSPAKSVTEGERFPLMLIYRNTGKEELTFLIEQDHWNYPPTVQDENGHSVRVSFSMHWFFVAPLKITLKPGEAWCEMTPGLYLGERMPSIKPVAGKYKLTYPQGISDWQYVERLEPWSSPPGLPFGLPNLSTPEVPDLSTPKTPAPSSPEEVIEKPPVQEQTMVVQSPTWSEQLATGTIEFEIAPAPNGGPLAARVLAMTDEPASQPHGSASTQESPSMPPEHQAHIKLDDLVYWSKAVDGLQAGFWLQKTGEPLNQRVPYNGLVTYRVVVRNKTDKPRDCLVRLLQYGPDVPYLISSDEINPALEAPELPQKCRAVAAPHVLDGIDAACIVSLASGESFLLPGEYRLFVGDQPQTDHPHIAEIREGMNWIVQPVLARTLTAAEQAVLKGDPGTFAVTQIDREGNSRQTNAKQVPAPSDRYTHIIKIQLEVGTLNAAAFRHAEQATWGEVDQGMQCGIRLLNPRASYQTGDTLEAELLHRNASEAAIKNTLPGSLDLVPIIEDANGGYQSIDFGARYDLLPFDHEFQPGEVRSLGVVKVTLVLAGTPSPKSNMEPGHVTLPPGKYKLLGNGGVGEISPNSGKIAFTVAEPMAAKPEPAKPDVGKAIRGQIIDEAKQGIPLAEVLVVAGSWEESRDGHVIAQGIADVLGNFSIAIPENELGKRQWGQVWRRAPGYAAARGNTIQPLESLLDKPLTYGPLVQTNGLHVVVHDPAGKPLSGTHVTALGVRVNRGVGYALPAAWRDDNSGVSDAEGRVHLPYIDPGSVDRLELAPAERNSCQTEFGPNYFLNYRPQETGPHFIFPTYETGTIAGQLVAAPGVTLPRGLITLRSMTGKVDVTGIRIVPIDEEGRFQIPDMPVGEISIPKFLDDAQPLRPWISERAFVKAGETTKLEIPIVKGTRVRGRVEKSDTKAGVADYEFEVYYGPAIKFRGSDLWLLKQAVKTDAEGKYELLLPPGPINLRLTRGVDGYSDATSWLPREKRGSWGPLEEIPAAAEFEVPPISLVKMLPIQGKLIDQQDQPLANDDWSVYGYPDIPGESENFVMNSMPGVSTDNEGRFAGRYPATYPPVRWSVSHRVWKTKYEFDDIKYRAEISQKEPLILRVDTTQPLGD